MIGIAGFSILVTIISICCAACSNGSRRTRSSPAVNSNPYESNRASTRSSRRTRQGSQRQDGVELENLRKNKNTKRRNNQRDLQVGQAGVGSSTSNSGSGSRSSSSRNNSNSNPAPAAARAYQPHSSGAGIPHFGTIAPEPPQIERTATPPPAYQQASRDPDYDPTFLEIREGEVRDLDWNFALDGDLDVGIARELLTVEREDMVERDRLFELQAGRRRRRERRGRSMVRGRR